MSHVEIESEFITQGREIHTVRLYGHHPDNYVSAFRIDLKEGTHWLNSLAGSGFYKLIGPHIKGIFEQVGATKLHAKVLASHDLLIKRALRAFTNYEVLGQEIGSKGRKFSIIALTVREAT